MNRDELQVAVNRMFESYGWQRSAVLLTIEPQEKSLATAFGLRLPLWLPLGLGGIPGGKITLDPRLLDGKYTDAEVLFVVGHEVTHIHHDHIRGNWSRFVTEVMVRLGDVGSELAAAVALVGLVRKLVTEGGDIFEFASGSVPESVAITRAQEITADLGGVFLSRNKSAAFSCLDKFVEGDLSKPSHTWEALGQTLPVMSMLERIQALAKSVNRLERAMNFSFT